jgi:hypothetical protein
MNDTESRFGNLRAKIVAVQAQITELLNSTPSLEANLALRSLMQEWKAIASEMNYWARQSWRSYSAIR